MECVKVLDVPTNKKMIHFTDLTKPIFVDQQLVLFFKNAYNLGLGYTREDGLLPTWKTNGKPIQFQLHLFLKYGLTNRISLQRLFKIYIRNYRLQENGEISFQANNEMYKYFGNIFTSLTKADQEKGYANIFNPYSLYMVDISRIVKACILADDQIEEIDEVKNVYINFSNDLIENNTESKLYIRFLIESGIIKDSYEKNIHSYNPINTNKYANTA